MVRSAPVLAGLAAAAASAFLYYAQSRPKRHGRVATAADVTKLNRPRPVCLDLSRVARADARVAEVMRVQIIDRLQSIAGDTFHLYLDVVTTSHHVHTFAYSAFVVVSLEQGKAFYDRNTAVDDKQTLYARLSHRDLSNMKHNTSLIRDYVVVGLLPLVARQMPCNDVASARCIVRVVRNFLAPTEQNQDPLFVDVLPLLSNANAVRWLVNRAARFVAEINRNRRAAGLQAITVVAALETRGFMFGAMLAAKLDCAFVPLRRPGKYPGRVVVRQTFMKATGQDTLELDGTVLGAGEAVLLVDDLLVSGASLAAATRAVEAARGSVVGGFVALEVRSEINDCTLAEYGHTWPLCAPIVLNSLTSCHVEDLLDAKNFPTLEAWCFETSDDQALKSHA